MTGNELDIPYALNPPLSIKQIVANAFRSMGKDRYNLRQQVRHLQEELDRMRVSRARLVDTMGQLATLLELPHADPVKILEAVRAKVQP
jgi:hypothetical protein